MRCEICGVPISPEETRCSRCIERRQSSPDVLVNTKKKEKRTLDLQDSWDTIAAQADNRVRLPVPKKETDLETPSSVVLEDKYYLKEELGRGAMGTVFLAEDKTLKRQVAVKFLLPELADSIDCATRFRREAVGMAAVRDNNVAQIYAFGEHGGIPYFVMEHLDGESVESLIDSHNRRGFYIPLEDIVDILIQSLGGLTAIHKAGAVHRDIKPANIMVSGNPMRAVIMDFGLVRDVQVEDEMRVLAGTPAYIAPELVEGRPDADRSPATDIYSLGATAYEMITGSLPFNGDTWIEILRKHLTEMPSYPSERRPGLPEEMDNIVLRALSKDPKERYRDCAEFYEDLLAVESIATPARSRPSIPANGPSNKKRRSARKISSIPPSAMRSTPSSVRGRLLVVDPDSKFRDFVLHTAKAAVPGCRIQSARDGAMALKLVEEFNPHVLLLDLSLPEVNGLEVVATLRGEKKFDNLAIVVVADKAGHKEANILGGMKVTRFLTKPIDDDTLANVLRPILEQPIRLSHSAPPPYSE